MENLELKIAEEKLGAMIRIPTVSRHEWEDLSQFYRFHEELEKLFPLIHEKLEKTALNGTLIYYWKGSDATLLPILLMGHQDVVPATDEGWSVPAFSGAVKDGNIYGRGAMDCKGTMYVQLQAVEELLAEGFVPACDVYLEYSINEETGGDGAAAAMRHLRDKGIAHADLVHFLVLLVEVDEAIQSNGITSGYITVAYFDVRLQSTASAETDEIQGMVLFFGHTGFQVDVGQSVELVHDDVEVVGAHAGAEHSDALAVEIACAGDKLTVLSFHLYLVEE